MTLVKAQPSMPRHFSSLNSFRAAVCLTLLLFAGSVAHAEKTDQLKPQGYVNDFAGVLSAPAKAQLTALCTEVDQKAKAQIAVVTVKSLDGQAVEDYAVDLATRWGIGPKQADRGILILLAVEDRKYWTSVGYGLEPGGGSASSCRRLLRRSPIDHATRCGRDRRRQGRDALRQFTRASAQCSSGRYGLVDRSNLASAFYNFCRLFDHERQQWGWP
jgi:hypothetical protein